MKKSRSILAYYKPALVGSLGLVCLLGYQNCSQGFKSADSNGTQALSSSVSTGNAISLSQPVAQVANLGTQLTIPVTITADPGYSGTVDLQISEAELQVLDPGAAISFSFTPASVTLSGGAPAASVLTVNISTMAPDFAGSVFHIQATDSVDSTITSTVTVPLQVNAIYDLFIYPPKAGSGTVPENWSVPVGATVQFISHKNGLLFRVNNMDSVVHLMHSTDGTGGLPLPHESLTVPYPGTATIGMPASPDGGKTPGGIYQNTIAAGTTIGVAGIYCHDHESSTEQRTMLFNVPQPTVPTVTFNQVFSQIYLTSCATCHSGAAGSPAGALSLANYANFKLNGNVVPGSAITSTVYDNVSGPTPSMPMGGTPLSPILVQMLGNWINEGASNN